MRNVIYTALIGYDKEGYAGTSPETKAAMEAVTLPTIKEYAERIDADLYCIANVPESFCKKRETSNESFRYDWSYGVLARLYAFVLMKESDYDNMLFLDADVQISKDSPNIFETEFNEFGAKFSPKAETEQVDEWCKRAYRNSYDEYLNSAVMVLPHSTAAKMATELGGRAMNACQLSDRPFLTHILNKLQINYVNLAHSWHRPHSAEPTYFTHYMGSRGKKALRDKALQMWEPLVAPDKPKKEKKHNGTHFLSEAYLKHKWKVVMIMNDKGEREIQPSKKCKAGDEFWILDDDNKWVEGKIKC